MKRLFLAALGAVALLVSLSGCSPAYNYAGDGNDFVLTGVINKVEMSGFLWDDGVHVVNLDPASVHIDSAHGDAADWFAQPDGFLHSVQDNFTFANCYREVTNGGWDVQYRFVGAARSATGRPIDVSQLQAGDHVRVAGKIHASKSGKTTSNRAVFHLIEVLPR